MRIALYARVSKGEEQHPENQLLKLREWAKKSGNEIAGEFVDEISSRDTRPQKEEVLRKLRLGEIEGVAFASLDRWGRSLSELILELEEFEKRGYTIISLKEGFRFDTAADRMFVRMLAVFADFERELIRERTLWGLARAKAQGKIGGRHPLNCGCGVRDSKGNIHNGLVKPIRNESNKQVGWQYPDGRQVAINATHKESKQTPGENTRVRKGRVPRAR